MLEPAIPARQKNKHNSSTSRGLLVSLPATAPPKAPGSGSGSTLRLVNLLSKRGPPVPRTLATNEINNKSFVRLNVKDHINGSGSGFTSPQNESTSRPTTQIFTRLGAKYAEASVRASLRNLEK